MGNTSSQPVVSTQVPRSQPTPKARSIDGDNDSSAGSEIVVSPVKKLATRQATQPSRKRARPSDQQNEENNRVSPKRAKRVPEGDKVIPPDDAEVAAANSPKDGITSGVTMPVEDETQRNSSRRKSRKPRTTQPAKPVLVAQQLRLETARSPSDSQASSPQQLKKPTQTERTVAALPKQPKKRKTKAPETADRAVVSESQPVIPKEAIQRHKQAVNPVSKPGLNCKAAEVQQNEVVSAKVTRREEQTVNPVGKPVPKRNKRSSEVATAQNAREEPASVQSPRFTAISATQIPTVSPAGAPATSKRKERQRLRSNPEVPETQVQAASVLSSLQHSNTQRRRVRESATASQPAAVEKMPTPPESPGRRADFEPVDATDQVQDWLNSQASPIIEESGIEPDPEPPCKRKRNSQHKPDDDEEYQDQLVDAEDAPVAIKDRTVSAREPNIERTEKVYLPEPLVNGPTSGAFTDAEKIIADDVFNYIVQNDPEVEDASSLKVRTKDWKNVGQFKVEIQDALPRRTRPAVRKFCQRRYHGSDRGPWTEEQDEVLRKTYIEHPDQWAVISEFVNRTSQDCRDRYKNIVQYGDDLLSGPWSQAEETSLMAAVEECIDMIKKECKKDHALINNRARLEEMLDWKTVAAKMSGRSRMRCLKKWQQLKRRGTTHLNRTASTTAPVSIPDVNATFNLQSKKMRAIESKIKLFELGDYYDVLCEIYTAVDDHAKVFHNESTLWSVISTKNPGSKFESALRRRAYHEVFEVWGWKEKKKVRKAQTLAAKSKAMAAAIEKSVKKKGIELVREYKPEVLVKLQPEKARKPAAERAKSVPLPMGSRKSGQQRSERYVINSDDEGENNNGNDNEAEGDEVASTMEAAKPATKTAHADEDEDRHITNDEERIIELTDDAASDPAFGSALDVELAETPHHAALASAASDDVAVSSINSEIERSVRNAQLSHDDFVQRCQAVGRQQHSQYTRRRQRRQRRREQRAQAQSADYNMLG